MIRRTGQKHRFIGRFYHALEQKGRLSIPPTLRQGLGESAILTRGLDGCLFLFPEANWSLIAQEAETLPLTKKQARDWVRLLANNATTVDPDRLGRIRIPEYLQEMAALTKSIVIVGSLTRIEIWDQTAYHRYLKTLESQAEIIAESLTPDARSYHERPGEDK